MELSKQQMLWMFSFAVVCLAISYYLLNQHIEDPFPRRSNRNNSIRELRKMTPLDQNEIEQLNDRYRGGMGAGDHQENEKYTGQKSKTVGTDPHGDEKRAKHILKEKKLNEDPQANVVHPQHPHHSERVEENRKLRELRQVASQRHLNPNNGARP